MPEDWYHSEGTTDFGEKPNLSASAAKAMLLQSPKHAHMYHPRLGGQHKTPTTDMDRGTLCHSLILGVGGKIAVVEFDDWRTKASKELRDRYRSEGKLTVTRKLYEEALEAAMVLKPKLEARGFPLAGKSEVTITWEETAANGDVVPCRMRSDHIDGPEIFDLKITESANPQFIERQIVRMGYDIQRASYERALSRAVPEYVGRSRFTLLFCEPNPPYCITPVRMAGSLRMLGEMKWQRAVNMWAECLRSNHWPEYTEDVVFAEAKPWEIDAESAA